MPKEQRRCKLCKELGHNRRSCARKEADEDTEGLRAFQLETPCDGDASIQWRALAYKMATRLSGILTYNVIAKTPATQDTLHKMMERDELAPFAQLVGVDEYLIDSQEGVRAFCQFQLFNKPRMWGEAKLVPKVEGEIFTIIAPLKIKHVERSGFGQLIEVSYAWALLNNANTCPMPDLVRKGGRGRPRKDGSKPKARKTSDHWPPKGKCLNTIRDDMRQIPRLWLTDETLSCPAPKFKHRLMKKLYPEADNDADRFWDATWDGTVT